MSTPDQEARALEAARVFLIALSSGNTPPAPSPPYAPTKQHQQLGNNK